MEDDSQKESFSLLKIVFSKDFIILFLLTNSKTFTNFVYGDNFSEIGMALIQDNDFITKLTIFGGIFNFVTRYQMGNLYNIFGLKKLYLINFLLEMTESLILYFFGSHKWGFVLFMIIFRCSSGAYIIFIIIRNALYLKLYFLH